MNINVSMSRPYIQFSASQGKDCFSFLSSTKYCRPRAWGAAYSQCSSFTVRKTQMTQNLALSCWLLVLRQKIFSVIGYYLLCLFKPAPLEVWWQKLICVQITSDNLQSAPQNDFSKIYFPCIISTQRSLPSKFCSRILFTSLTVSSLVTETFYVLTSLNISP